MIKEKASAKVFHHIEKMILQKNWIVGDKITSENKLAEDLGVSRISVREAIGSFVTLNILEKKKGGGTYVKQLTPNNYMEQLIPLLTVGDVSYLEIMETRLALDVQAVSLFVNVATSKHIKDLERILKQMADNVKNSNEFYQKDANFHQYIADHCQNPILSKITNILFHVTLNCAYEGYHSLTYTKRIEEHSLLLGAIKNKDLELSILYCSRHIKRTIQDLKKNSNMNR